MCVCGIEEKSLDAGVFGVMEEQVQPRVRAVVEYGGLDWIFFLWLPASWREFLSLFPCVEVSL